MTNLTEGGSQTRTFENFYCSPSLHFLGILLFLLLFTRNLPFIRRTNSCITVWQQLISSLVLLSILSSRCCLFDVHGSRALECLSIRKWRIVHNKLYTIFSVFVDVDCNKRGQTSCPVIEAQIQTSCNFEANVYRCSYLLGCIRCSCFMPYFSSQYSLLV